MVAAGTVEHMRTPGILVPFAVATVVITSCGSDDSTTTSTPSTPSTASVPAAPTSDASAAGTTAADARDVGAEAVQPQRFPDVIDAEAEFDGETWTISATVSSPYDTPERYADAWRVVGPDGSVYGERILLHDHATEQPFTRSATGIEIPEGVTEVVVEGRDLENGYGGTTFTLTLPR